MAYPQGYLYQPSASLALYSCPAYSSSVISGPRTEELGRSSSGSAFAPYAAGSAAAFSGASPGYNSHLQPYSADAAAAAAAAATFTSYVVSKVKVIAQSDCKSSQTQCGAAVNDLHAINTRCSRWIWREGRRSRVDQMFPPINSKLPNNLQSAF